MYCPRCLKSIPDDKVDDISEKLKSTMGNRLLEEGKCPVCGTVLVREYGTVQKMNDIERGNRS